MHMNVCILEGIDFRFFWKIYMKVTYLANIDQKKSCLRKSKKKWLSNSLQKWGFNFGFSKFHTCKVKKIKIIRTQSAIVQKNRIDRRCRHLGMKTTSYTKYI